MRGWKPDHRLRCRPSHENAQPGLQLADTKVSLPESLLKYCNKNQARVHGPETHTVCEGPHPGSPALCCPWTPPTSCSSPPSDPRAQVWGAHCKILMGLKHPPLWPVGR